MNRISQKTFETLYYHLLADRDVLQEWRRYTAAAFGKVTDRGYGKTVAERLASVLCDEEFDPYVSRPTLDSQYLKVGRRMFDMRKLSEAVSGEIRGMRPPKSDPPAERDSVMFGYRGREDKYRTGYLKASDRGYEIVDRSEDATVFKAGTRHSAAEWAEFLNAEPELRPWVFHPVHVF